MIQLPSQDTRLAALRSQEVTPVTLITLGNPINKRITDSPRPITISSTTWAVEEGLVGMTPPAARRELGRDVYEIEFIDDAPGDADSWASLIENSIGAAVTVQVSFVQANGTLTGLLELYSGKLAGSDRRVSNDGVTTRARFTGPFARLDDSSALLLTDHDQRRRSATDTSLKFVSDSRVLNWGKG